MNIRSLLIGSAATMVAVSGAQAADAVVVEPEPVEYVRVCDAYGTGFFFIPGTETCIAFNGFIRSGYSKSTQDISRTTFNKNAAGDFVAVAGSTVISDDDTSVWRQRARFNMDTRNETEWGTLRGLFRLEATDNEANDAAGGALRMDVALITLAGFRAGWAGANYWSTNHGFGGINAEADAFGFDGPYGFGDSTLFDYTFAAEGFAVTIGVEDLAEGANDFNGTSRVNGATAYANFYAGFNYSGDWGGVAFTAVHDSASIDMTSANATALAAGQFVERGNWAWKASVNLDLSEFIPGGSLHGWYMDDGDAVTGYVSNGTNAESIWGIGFQANLTDEVEFWANYWDTSGGNVVTDVAGGVSLIGKDGDRDQWAIGLNWYPSATPGFHIKAAYMQGSNDDQVTQAATAGNGLQRTSSDFDAFEIILRRDF